MNELAEKALYYAALAWPVLPLRPGDKRPLGSLVPHGLKQASTEPEVIAGWWRHCPAANVGLVTGVAFDVVDIDGLVGLESLNVVRLDRPTTWGPEARTGGGGWHLYHLPTGLGNRAGIAAGVDYRGRGGYVVAPPSIHPSGERYVWQEGAGPTEALEPVPAWMLGLLHRPTPALPRRLASDGLSPYGLRALDAEAGRVALAPVGARNDQLNRAAFALGQLVAGGVLPAELVAERLLVAALRAGLGQAEAERSIASGLRAGARQPRKVPG